MGVDLGLPVGIVLSLRAARSPGSVLHNPVRIKDGPETAESARCVGVACIMSPTAAYLHVRGFALYKLFIRFYTTCIGIK